MSSGNNGGAMRLWLAIIVIGFGWLVALPAVSGLPGIARYLRRLDDKGIDASAMFYTELESHGNFDAMAR